MQAIFGMKKLVFGFIGVTLSLSALAHEMTPTYPKWKSSHMDGVVSTTMEMFNKREDVEYYEIGVFDSEWNPIPFVSKYRVINLKYLGHVKFEVFLREKDKARAEYICSKSKLRKEDTTRTAVSSRICSRFRD